MFEVRIDGDFTEALERFGPRVKKLARESVNKVARQARTEFVRDMTSEVNLGRNYFGRRAVAISFASASRAEAVIETPREGMLLHRYQARKEKTGGVSVQVLRAGSRKTLRSAFVRKLRSGAVGILQRRDEGLKVLYGPSPDQMFFRLRPQIADEVEDRLVADLQAKLVRVFG